MIRPYLHVTAGPYGLLLGVERVLEVGDAPEGIGERLAWRGRMLPVVDLAERLDAPGGGTALVVYGDAAAPVALLAGRVVGLRPVDDRAFHPVPAIDPRLAALIDRLTLDPATRLGLLHLRADALADGAAAPMAEEASA